MSESVQTSVRAYSAADVAQMASVWNEVVEGGIAFPQEEPLGPSAAEAFFSSQSHCGVAVVDGSVAGLYILHPNNVGRCSHVANASFAVSSRHRGRGIGRALVEDCLKACADLGFKGLQFNAVVDSNLGARHLYESLGFADLAVIPGGFRMKDGTYEDIHVYYRSTEAR